MDIEIFLRLSQYNLYIIFVANVVYLGYMGYQARRTNVVTYIRNHAQSKQIVQMLAVLQLITAALTLAFALLVREWSFLRIIEFISLVFAIMMLAII